MCCLITVLGLLGPRAAIIVWWLFAPLRWAAAFHGSFLIPAIGFLFLPWTTLAWVLVAPTGMVLGFGWFILALGVIADVFTWTGGGVGNRSRFRRGSARSY